MTKIRKTYEETKLSCRRCGNRTIRYSADYDAYFCNCKDKWLEGKCSDPNCHYCPYRPEKPSNIEWVDEREVALEELTQISEELGLYNG